MPTLKIILNHAVGWRKLDLQCLCNLVQIASIRKSKIYIGFYSIHPVPIRDIWRIDSIRMTHLYAGSDFFLLVEQELIKELLLNTPYLMKYMRIISPIISLHFYPITSKANRLLKQ